MNSHSCGRTSADFVFLMYQFLLSMAECYLPVHDVGWLLIRIANSTIYFKTELQPDVSIAPSMRGFRNRFGLFSRNV